MPLMYWKKEISALNSYFEKEKYIIATWKPVPDKKLVVLPTKSISLGRVYSTTDHPYAH